MKPQSYQAAIYRDIGKVEVVELAYPECGDLSMEEALPRVEAVLTTIIGLEV